jgi:hypothetical protein
VLNTFSLQLKPSDLVKTIATLTLTLLTWVVAAAQDAQIRTQARYDPASAKRDLPGDIKDLIKNAKKQTVFQITGVTTFSERVLKTDKLVFEPGSSLVLTGLRQGDSLIIIAGEVYLQDPTVASRILRDPGFAATPGENGSPGPIGQPDYGGAAGWRRMSGNGGPGGNGNNGKAGEPFKPPLVYLLVDKMRNPVLPARFVLDFTGVQGGSGGNGGAGGRGGNGDFGWSAHCNWMGMCESGPGRGGDGGPGGVCGRGGDAAAGGPGFDLILAGSEDFLTISEDFTILNKGGEPGVPGPACAGGPGGYRGGGGQTCGTCNSRGDGVNGPPGGSLGSGTSTAVAGTAGSITLAHGVDVLALLRP